MIGSGRPEREKSDNELGLQFLGETLDPNLRAELAQTTGQAQTIPGQQDPGFPLTWSGWRGTPNVPPGMAQQQHQAMHDSIQTIQRMLLGGQVRNLVV